MLTATERLLLIEIAREAIAARVAGRTPPDRGPLDGRLGAPGAAFVTLRAGERLRGCVGSIDAVHPLGVAVAHGAASSAAEDPRFDPVGADELAGLSLELSILGPLEPVGVPADITIGRHGLVVARGSARGLLLPQVAVEWRWDAEVFLDQTCVKAGLPSGAWREEAVVSRFEAEVFGAPVLP